MASPTFSKGFLMINFSIQRSQKIMLKNIKDAWCKLSSLNLKVSKILALSFENLLIKICDGNQNLNKITSFYLVSWDY